MSHKHHSHKLYVLVGLHVVSDLAEAIIAKAIYYMETLICSVVMLPKTEVNTDMCTDRCHYRLLFWLPGIDLFAALAATHIVSWSVLNCLTGFNWYCLYGFGLSTNGFATHPATPVTRMSPPRQPRAAPADFEGA